MCVLWPHRCLSTDFLYIIKIRCSYKYQHHINNYYNEYNIY